MDEQTPGVEARERAAVAEVLTAVLRHDLRNRFSSIRNASYYLMKQTQKTDLWKADPRVEVFFQLIDRELASAEELLSARNLAVLPAAQERVVLCDAAERALAVSHIPPAIRVERTWQDKSRVEGDGENFALLTRCLIENAVEAMPQGGTLGVRTLQGDEGRVILEVTDTGSGMSDEQRSRAFEPFVTTKPGHAGVGLCIVQRLALRGRAWVELKAGESVGTRARVSFPIAEEPGAAGGV
ncbi:sensor histidine kinase [Hyalangium versicolor]|uniref:sensor histidine kinase n=1 Tax=Hyalangium versicolor TaxID=2861190 RepID=UPI001CCFFAD3|nr:HAMP domain-containing sensor histidine kinase [Hyalangium versicolor]